MIVRAVPIILIAALIGQLQLPASILHAALFVVSLMLGLILAVVFFAIVTISLLWTISGEGMVRIAPPIVMLLSGMLIPLPLFPESAQPLVRALPFRGMMDVPFRIYLGQLAPREVLGGFVQQVLWTAAFIVIGRMLLARGLNRLVIQGG